MFSGSSRGTRAITHTRKRTRQDNKKDNVWFTSEAWQTLWGRTITFLHRNGLLASSKQCSRLPPHIIAVDYTATYNINRHNMSMQEWSREDVSDNISWYFPQCYTRKSIHDWRFWLSQCLQKWLPLLHYWVCQTSVTEAMDDAEVDKCTTIYAYQWFCEICSSALMQAPQSRWYWDNSIY